MKTDRRVAYTKRVLKESLFELLREKPAGRISVKELCEKADINRATFYSHFSDVYDMLSKIEDELYETIRSSLEKGWKSKNITELLTGICIYIKQNGAVFQALLSENGDKDFLDRVLYVAQDKCVSDWKTLAPTADLSELEKIYSFFSHGSAAVVLSWVQSGMKKSPVEIASFIEQITNKGLGLLHKGTKK